VGKVPEKSTIISGDTRIPNIGYAKSIFCAENQLDPFIRFDTIPALAYDGQTDRQRSGPDHIPHYAYASRDKN